jgi:hypothetical protein
VNKSRPGVTHVFQHVFLDITKHALCNSLFYKTTFHFKFDLVWQVAIESFPLRYFAIDLAYDQIDPRFKTPIENICFHGSIRSIHMESFIKTRMLSIGKTIGDMQLQNKMMQKVKRSKSRRGSDGTQTLDMFSWQPRWQSLAHGMHRHVPGHRFGFMQGFAGHRFPVQRAAPVRHHVRSKVPSPKKPLKSSRKLPSKSISKKSNLGIKLAIVPTDQSPNRIHFCSSNLYKEGRCLLELCEKMGEKSQIKSRNHKPLKPVTKKRVYTSNGDAKTLGRRGGRRFWGAPRQFVPRPGPPPTPSRSSVRKQKVAEVPKSLRKDPVTIKTASGEIKSVAQMTIPEQSVGSKQLPIIWWIMHANSNNYVKRIWA